MRERKLDSPPTRPGPIYMKTANGPRNERASSAICRHTDFPTAHDQIGPAHVWFVRDVHVAGSCFSTPQGCNKLAFLCCKRTIWMNLVGLRCAVICVFNPSDIPRVPPAINVSTQERRSPHAALSTCSENCPSLASDLVFRPGFLHGVSQSQLADHLRRCCMNLRRRSAEICKGPQPASRVDTDAPPLLNFQIFYLLHTLYVTLSSLII